jgi:N-acetylgalactosamine-N,N'-diacetylbacillosaminyl-diphospho-undecaprenol 4-alpha-N-acetylgalactosaminyltransferase
MGSKHEAQVVNHGIVSRYKIKGLLGRFNLFLIKYLYAHADMIILISKEMKNDLNDLFKFTNHQIVINNPYNIQHILQYKNYQSRAFLFDKQKKYLIGMGRLISLKRYQDIINVLSKLNNHIELILLGEGEEKNKLQELSHSLKIGNRVHFLGNVDNPFQYLSKADIFILPSETEGFPNSIIEALACEIPIISSDCLSGPREILQIKPNFGERLVDNIEVCDYGILYPTAHIECLQKAVELLLKDETLRISFKKKSFDRANQFNVDNIIIKYKEVLDIE